MVPPAEFRQSPSFYEAEAYFLAAQKRMGMLLCRSGVIDAQCFFLAGVYLMTTLRPVQAWKMFVQALACCQGFLVPVESAIMTVGEWQRRRRQCHDVVAICHKHRSDNNINISHISNSRNSCDNHHNHNNRGRLQSQAAHLLGLLQVRARAAARTQPVTKDV